MSISSEISRISGNVSAALTAIGNKGVTVPQGSTSDDLATLIGLIQTGGGSTLVQKNITLNGTYDPDDDNADGYSEVTVNVQGGASMSEVANTYGTELVITSAPGSTPSATRHTLYFEYEDESTETEYAYYDDSFISSAITATTPTTRSSKTVTSAQLDGVEWYSYTPTPTPPEPSGDYTTLYEGSVTTVDDDGDNMIEISELASVWLNSGETYRVTLNGTAYVTPVSFINDTPVIGNANFFADATGIPFIFYNLGQGHWTGYVRTAGTYSLKIEKQVST